jgi:hypothetical protein
MSRIPSRSAVLAVLLVVVIAGLAIGAARAWSALRSIDGLHRAHPTALTLDRAQPGCSRHPGRQR